MNAEPKLPSQAEQAKGKDNCRIHRLNKSVKAKEMKKASAIKEMFQISQDKCHENQFDGEG